jgi:hypothetical protein
MTCDEPTHLYAGYRYWKCGDFGFGAEHPPLAKLVAAAPLLSTHMDVDCRVPTRDEAWAALDWIYAHNLQRTLALGRAAVCLFALGLCLLIWVSARRMFGFGTAVVAILLYLFDPNVLSAAPLVSTDMVLTFTFPLAAYAFYEWTRRRSGLSLLLAGVAAGLTLTAKMSGVIIMPTLFFLALTDALVRTKDWRLRRGFAIRNLLAVGLIGILALGTVWAAYGFHFAARPNGAILPPTPIGSSISGRIFTALGQHRLLPEAYVEGLRRIGAMSGHPYLMFLWGRLHMTDAWYFFPANMLVKYTVGLLALLVTAAFGLKLLFRQQRHELLFVAVPGLVFLVTTITMNRMSSNIRHVLPATWSLMIFAAAGCVALARHTRWVKYLLVVALGWHAVSSLRASPNYLSYANELWGGPASAYKWVPNNDMGEALQQVRTYVEKHPGEPCWLAHIYLTDIQPYQVPCHEFWGGNSEPIPAHIHGLVILSSVFVENAQLGWLYSITKRHQPIATIGGSAMLVYEGDFDTRDISGPGYALLASRIMNKGEFETALPLAKAGVDASPENAWVRSQYCQVLIGVGAREQAQPQCETARVLEDAGRALSHYDARYHYDVSDGQAGVGIEEAVRAKELNAGREFEAALPHARKAVALAGRSGFSHFQYCQALLGVHAFQLADSECQTARILQMNDPIGHTYTGMGQPRDMEMVDLSLYAIEGDLH